MSVAFESEPGANLDLRRLETDVFGRIGFSAHQVDSTNERLWESARVGAPHGAICVAREQVRGRGRQDRVWRSPPDTGLYLSILLRQDHGVETMAPFSLVCALTVAEAVEAEVGVPCRLKWPNDVYVHGKKLAGILLESRTGAPDAVIAGIGLNLCPPPEGWPEPLRDSATSLQDETGLVPTRDSMICAILNRLEPAYRLFVSRGLDPFLTPWAARSVLAGSHVRVQIGSQTFVGEAVGIDGNGQLLVRDRDGHERAFVAGEVHLLGGKES